MSAFCPQCETDLDPRTGACPACRWSPFTHPSLTPSEPRSTMSLTERYRGTQWESPLAPYPVSESSSISRGRVFVLVALVALAAVYGVIMVQMGAL
jgi:hypothetical protein